MGPNPPLPHEEEEFITLAERYIGQRIRIAPFCQQVIPTNMMLPRQFINGRVSIFKKVQNTAIFNDGGINVEFEKDVIVGSGMFLNECGEEWVFW